MGTTTKMFAAGAFLALFATTAQAQSMPDFTLELRGGGGFATEGFSGTDLNPGVGFEANLGAQLLPFAGVYVGWDFYNFGLDRQIAGYEGLHDTGYAFGLRLAGPEYGTVSPWLIGGGVYDHIELNDDDSDDTVSSDHVLGWEVGGGLNVRIDDRFSFTPGVRYRTFSPTLTELDGEVDLSYMAIEIGLSARLGGGSGIAAFRH